MASAEEARLYLRRIGWPGYESAADDGSSPPPPLPEPTLATLVELHRRHTQQIPFENLSFVHHQLKARERLTDPPNLIKRLVLRRRGGLCQEMNGLFYYMLRGLGFHCYQGLAHIVRPGTSRPPEQPFSGIVSSTNMGTTVEVLSTHQVIHVRADGDWHLCDVGFGSQGLMEPLLLRAHDAPGGDAEPAWVGGHQAGVDYRLRWGVLGSAEHLSSADAASHPEAASHLCYYLQIRYPSGGDGGGDGGSSGGAAEPPWTDLYAFTRQLATKHLLAVAASGNFRSHPVFSHNTIACLPTDSGRIILHNWNLKERAEGKPTVTRELASEAERDEVLAAVFNIDLTPPPPEEAAEQAAAA